MEFTSVGLKASGNKGHLKLEKKVEISQGKLRLKSAKADIFSNQDTKEVERILIEGNVYITNGEEDSENKIKAKSDKATFYADEQLLILKGNARLWRGTDLMRGKIIRYNLKTGWIEVEQVQGVMKQNEEN